MKKIAFAAFASAAALAALASPSLAMNKKASAQQLELAAQKEQAASRIVPVAELDALTALWNGVSADRIRSTDAERTATDELSATTQNAYNAATRARLALNRAEYDKQAGLVRSGREEMCAILSGC